MSTRLGSRWRPGHASLALFRAAGGPGELEGRLAGALLVWARQRCPRVACGGPRAQYAPFAPMCAASAHNTGMRAPHFARVPIVCQVTKFSGTRRQFRKGPEHSRRASIRFSEPLGLKLRDRDRQGVPPAHPSHVLGRDGWRRADRHNAEVRTLGLPMRSCSARDLHRSM